MAENSKIEWTDATFNPWEGCSKVSAGCANCYAETRANRFHTAKWGPHGTRRVASESYWKMPLKWNREAVSCCPCSFPHPAHDSCNGRPYERPRVFCASLADVFEDWQGPMVDAKGQTLHDGKAWYSDEVWVPSELRIGQSVIRMDDVRARLFALIAATPNLDWLLLTKRPERFLLCWPYQSMKNVWLGTSVEDRKAVERIDYIRGMSAAAVRFLSIEPLLEDLGQINLEDISWVIVGGESGPGARPMHPDWVRSIRDQCQVAGVPFFFKQWGEWGYGSVKGLHGKCLYSDGRLIDLAQQAALDEERLSGKEHNRYAPTVMTKVGKKAAGRLLDGREWNEFPKEAL